MPESIRSFAVDMWLLTSKCLIEKMDEKQREGLIISREVVEDIINEIRADLTK